MKYSGELKKKTNKYRQTTLNTICSGGGGHITASLSIVEILAVLYHSILRIDSKAPSDPGRDRFILSKGHACVALYAVLSDKGFFPEAELKKFGTKDTFLGGHPDMHKVPGIEASTGALGHGFSFGAGVALAGKLDEKDYRVFTLIGDGECQEGSVWETALFAAQNKLDNLIAIIDHNKYQAMDKLDNIISVQPLADKWRSFGWEVKEVDGHDMEELEDTFKSIPFAPGKPSMVIANTVKGKGISFMENEAIWHYRNPNEEEYRVACGELGMQQSALGH